ncbi:PAS domain S-box protein [Candidatus Saccharibacteria bacterium]|nr:PAS domain S-box protein [Candidatus Saccharibacteria bacterium]
MTSKSVLDNKAALAIIETVRESALVLDEDLRVTFANESFYETFEVNADQTEGRLIYELGNKQWNIPKLKTLLEEILPTKSSFDNYEIEHNFMDIGRKIMLLNARQLHGLEGQKPEIFLVIEDITARKQLENNLAIYTTGLEEKAVENTAALGLGKAREAAILESIGAGLIVLVDVNMGGKILYVNRACESMIGWKQSELVDKLVVDVIPREDKDGNIVPFKERVITKVLSGQAVVTDVNEPFYYIRKDNTKFPAASIITPIVVNKKIVGAVELFRDITKESAADKAKTEFASLVSHQLRTPFSTINWYVELILAGDVGKLNIKQTEYLQEVYRASQRMANLINVLLSISRIEMGISTDELTWINIVELAEVIISESSLETRKKGITLKSTYGKNIPEFYSDSKQVTMIFQNLLSNAIKYTKEGGTVSLKITSDKKQILISVTDSGIGIPKDAEPKIFTRFFRASNAMENESEGTGLGLYILKSVVNQMNGKVWFQSEVSKGSTFFVAFPVDKLDKVKKGR